jgi:hypothetical protein
MSRQNIARFVAACADNPTLKRELIADAPTLDAWVAHGARAGFDFSVGELHQLAEELTGQTLAAAEAIPALLGAGARPLSESELDRVSAGLGSWSKADGLAVSWDVAELNATLSRYRSE